MKKPDDDVEGMFVFQDINADEYSILQDIAKDYLQNGMMVSLSKAYFYGVVRGKRKERSKCKL